MKRITLAQRIASTPRYCSAGHPSETAENHDNASTVEGTEFLKGDSIVMVDIGRREGRKRMSLVLLLVAAFWPPLTCRAQQVIPYPPGVYGMWPVAMPISSSETQCSLTGNGALLHENQGVVGILLEVPWTSVGNLEASPDWTAMNRRLTEAHLCGLRVALSLSMPLASLPPWVVQQISNGTIQETVKGLTNVCPTGQAPCPAPVFWDRTFNHDRVAFIQAAAGDIATLPILVSQNIVAVLAQPFGAVTDDWNIPHSDSDVVAWQTAGYSTSNMFGAAQEILIAAANAFPSLNLKLPIQAEGTALDGTDPQTGTDVALATQVLSWAYGAYPKRFFAQLNFVNAMMSPPDCSSPCPLDMHHSPYSVFNLIRQYTSLW